MPLKHSFGKGRTCAGVMGESGGRQVCEPEVVPRLAST